MPSPLATAAAPFGRVLTAMVTPFAPDGSLDLVAAQKVAAHLVDAGNDGLAVSGTTGESPTMSPDEDGALLAAVVEAVGDRATVLAGVGNNDTQKSCRLARQAADAGAHGLLLVSPYYNKPPQAGLLRHFQAVTEAGGGTPVMLYDIPGRTGVRIALETYAAVAEDPRVVAVKDAVGDIPGGSRVMAETGLALYSGDDVLNLAWLTHGAAGIVSVAAHVAGPQLAALVAAVDAGRLDEAVALYRRLLPVVDAVMAPTTQGAITTKACLQALGVLEHRTVRSPLVDATDAQVEDLRAVLVAADLLQD